MALIVLKHRVLPDHQQLATSVKLPTWNQMMQHWWALIRLSPPTPSNTFGLIHSDHHHALVSPYSDQLVNGADAPPGQFTKHYHPLYVVVLQQVHIRAHLSDGANVHHHYIFLLGVTVFVESTGD